MKLKTKVLLASSLVVLGVLGTAEWIGFRQTSLFLNAHETNMATEMNHGLALAELRQGGQALLSRLATLHLIHGILTVTALVGALNMVWRRTVLGPLTELLRHINYMRRGNWHTAVPVRSRDEIGELTAAFNDLGGQLTMTVHQFAATSKLSGMALLGQSLARKAVAAADLIRASEPNVGSREVCVDDANRARLDLAAKLLDEIPVLFEQEFQRELNLHSIRPAPGSPELPDVKVDVAEAPHGTR